MSVIIPLVFMDRYGLFKSHPLLRVLVPGQIAWENAVTSYENRDYTAIPASLAAIAGEMGFSVALGELSSSVKSRDAIAGNMARNAAANSIDKYNKSIDRGVRSLEKRIAKHQKKMADFQANPSIRSGMETQSESVIRAVQEFRMRCLQKEIPNI